MEEPSNVDWQRTYAWIQYERGQVLRSLDRGAESAQAFSDCARAFALSGEQYHAARCHVLHGQKDEAFALLESWAERELGERRDIQKDVQFQSLHSDRRWKPLVERLKTASGTAD
jgi:hypothetical protein